MNINTVKFNNGKLKIMQVSDPQDLVHVRGAMVYMLNKAYDTLKPDLVLFTGDNILGNHLLDAPIGNSHTADGYTGTYERMCASIANICEPLEKRNIPFAMIFGNHDDINMLTKDEQCEIFKSYKMCLPMNDYDSTVDCDTYNIPIVNDEGRTVFNIYMVDSAWYDKAENKCYDAIKKETVDWYNKTSEALERNNGEKAPSLMFMHEPLPQHLCFLSECGKNDKDAVTDRGLKGKYYRLNKELASGEIHEYPSVCTDDYGLFDSVKARGDVMAIISGHDHINCFDGVWDGVRFIQTAGASFRCYGNRLRGVRMFTLDENKPGTFDTKVYTYETLCGNGPVNFLRYLWDADGLQGYKAALIAATTFCVSIGTYKVFKYCKGR